MSKWVICVLSKKKDFGIEIAGSFVFILNEIEATIRSRLRVCHALIFQIRHLETNEG